MNERQRVRGLKVAVIRAEEFQKKSGGTFLKVRLVREADDGSKTWLTGLVFNGNMKRTLLAALKPGMKILVSGNIKQSEYQKKDGTVGVSLDLFLEEVKYMTREGTTAVVDEFTEAAKPRAGEEAPF